MSDVQPGGAVAMLSAYRVVDATDHRGQLAGMILAGLGAEVILVEPPGGSPERQRGDGLEWWAFNRGKSSIVCAGDEEVLDLVRDADVLLDSGGRFDRDEIAARNPALVHVTITAFGSDGPKAGWAASDLTILAAGCAQVLNGDSDRAPVRTSVPQAWLHAGAEAAVGALLALTERRTSGLGQHVDVSAQQAVMQAGIPGVLLSPNANAEAQRTSGGILTGPVHLQFVYPALDGFVSITLLFGTMIGPFSRRLMQWVHEEGCCDAAMRDWDWNAFGLRLANDPAGAGELEAVKAAITELTSRRTKAELFAEARRRRLLLAPVATAAELVANEHLRDRGYWTEVEGRTCPGPFVKSSACPLPALGAPPALGEHANRRPLRPAAVAAARSQDGHRATSPLSGLKVVDLTWVFAGPLATRVLADFGATVIKIEGPGHPDASRGGGGALCGDLGLEGSVAFAHFNCGKLGLSLDLNNQAAKDVLLDLVRWADVLIESFTPGVMAAWGLGYDELRKVNPRLVMMSTSLMGQSGPLSEFAGFGNLAGAISGFYELTGWPDRAPAGPFLAYTDYVAPRYSVAALLAALDWRERTGCGQHLDLSQAEASIHFLAPAILDHTVNGVHPTRMGNADPFLQPHGVYPCDGNDAWVAIACETATQRRALAAVVGPLDDTALDDTTIAAWTASRTVADVEQVLQAAAIPVHGVQNSAACWADPQLNHRNHYLTVAHPVHGSCIVEAPRVVLSRTPGVVRRAGPAMGEHNDLVLRELLGYEDAAITALVIAGALG
jgi:crotonobetainyl-CoA:carnitine CoA-transferase CaiB-like acyl-CoA transferase